MCIAVYTQRCSPSLALRRCAWAAAAARRWRGSGAATEPTSCMEVEGGSWSLTYSSRKVLIWLGSAAALTWSRERGHQATGLPLGSAPTAAPTAAFPSGHRHLPASPGVSRHLPASPGISRHLPASQPHAVEAGPELQGAQRVPPRWRLLNGQDGHFLLDRAAHATSAPARLVRHARRTRRQRTQSLGHQ